MSSSSSNEDVPQLLEGAEHGDADAQVALGDAYVKGAIVARDFGEAAEWYGKAARQRHVRALFSLLLLAAVKLFIKNWHPCTGWLCALGIVWSTIGFGLHSILFEFGYVHNLPSRAGITFFFALLFTLIALDCEELYKNGKLYNPDSGDEVWKFLTTVAVPAASTFLMHA